MSLSASLLPEFEHEMAGTRKTLARVPEARFAWAPHPKSMTTLRLAAHLANFPSWVPMTLQSSELDVAGYKLPEPDNLAAILAHFDAGMAAARQAIEATSDAAWMEPWTLKSAGHVAFTMPRVAVFRSLILNHNIHHRGQMTVYLRQLGVPVPALYGPSADEQ
jgi:uncharacterized damage-inducible protein DinB